MSDARSTTDYRRVATFLVITFAFSWSQWLAVVASQQGWIRAHLTLTPLAIFGPLVGAIAVSLSRTRLTALLRTTKPRAPGILLLALLLPPLLIAIALALSALFTEGTRPLPPIRTTAIVFLGMFATAGIGEEIGWRGVLLPELRRSLSANRASALIALIWFGWHLPLYAVRGATQRDLPLIAFATGITAYSRVLTWLTTRARSTIAPMLFHASANTMLWLGLTMTKHTAAETWTTAIFVALISIIAITLTVRARKSNSPLPVGEGLGERD